MSQLEEIGQQVSTIASDLTKHANELHIFSTRLRQAAAEAAAVGRDSSRSGANGAIRAAQSLTEAANRCTQAAQQLVSGSGAAKQFVNLHVIFTSGSTTNRINDGDPSSGSSSNGLFSGDQEFFVASGFATEAGWAFFPSGELIGHDFTKDVPTYPGEFVLDLHGSPHVVHCGNRQLNAREFAQVIRGTSWSGQPIRLFSCWTGSDSQGFAQMLANELGISVTAPDKPVWSDSMGSPFVATKERVLGTGKRKYKFNYGKWQEFQPQY